MKEREERSSKRRKGWREGGRKEEKLWERGRKKRKERVEEVDVIQ